MCVCVCVRVLGCLGVLGVYEEYRLKEARERDLGEIIGVVVWV